MVNSSDGASCQALAPSLALTGPSPAATPACPIWRPTIPDRRPELSQVGRSETWPTARLQGIGIFDCLKCFHRARQAPFKLQMPTEDHSIRTPNRVKNSQNGTRCCARLEPIQLYSKLAVLSPLVECNDSVTPAPVWPDLLIRNYILFQSTPYLLFVLPPASLASFHLASSKMRTHVDADATCARANCGIASRPRTGLIVRRATTGWHFLIVSISRLIAHRQALVSI